MTAHLTATELTDLTRPSGYLGAAQALVDETLAALAWPRTDTE